MSLLDTIKVFPNPSAGNKHTAVVQFNGKSYRASIGRSGISSLKREGDGATPIGVFKLRQAFHRPDKLAEAPDTKLAIRSLTPNDAWCDDPLRPEYNQLVQLPFEPSHENLWRTDERYDIIVPISYNDDPAVANFGSAIFIHIAPEDYPPTSGCIALSKADLLEILANCDAATTIQISG